MCNVAITCILKKIFWSIFWLIYVMLCGWYLIKFCPGQYPMQPHWPLCIKINICWVDLTGIKGALLGWKSHHYSIPFTAGSTLLSSSTRFTNRAAFLFMSSDRRWKRWQSSRCSSSPLCCFTRTAPSFFTCSTAALCQPPRVSAAIGMNLMYDA